MNHITGNNYEDKLLVDRVLNGDSHAFGLIIKRSERVVSHIVFKMIRNAEDRKDVAQDIYLKAYKKLSDFKFESRLSTWIARIAFNTCMDDLRKKKLVLNHDISDEDVTELQSCNLTEQKELAEILKEEIERLPAVSRTLISLFHNADMSYEEIGEITGMPSGTVKSYLFRARRALKNNLLAEYKKEDL